MIIANAINFPLAIGAGLLVFVPLPLIVTLVESVVLRRVCNISVRQSFFTVFWANVLSTVAGWFVYGYQDMLLESVGIRTFTDFLRYYVWGATLLLIAIYYAKSVLVEGLVGVRWLIDKGVDVPRGKLWKGFVLANLATYVVMGPLFYFSTRPTTPGLELVDSPAEVVKCTDTVYFLSSEDDHLWRVRADGSGLEEVAPFAMTDFVVSADQNAFVYSVPDGRLMFHKRGKAPVELMGCVDDGWTRMADISKDSSMIAYVGDGDIRVFSVEQNSLVSSVKIETAVNAHYTKPILAWDAERLDVFHCYGDSGQLAWRISDGVLVSVSPTPRVPLRNYRRMEDRWERHRTGQRQGDFELVVPRSPFSISLVVEREGETVAVLGDNFGVIPFAGRGPREGTFLSEPGAVLCEGAGQIYVLNALRKRFAVLAAGHGHLIASSVTPHTASAVKLDED